ncbi:MAG: metallophosphoesterase [Candidatus Obscuribacterales bacterium]
MNDIWVISDTHFNHGNIIDYCSRPFKGIREMDEEMIARWNAVVKPQDKVYHLGDVYMGASKGYIEMVLSRLQGHKRLILGNHDNGKDQILQRYFQKIGIWRMFPEFGLLLTHVPVHESALFRGATGNEKNPKKLRNIHGHIHQNKSPSDDHKCVCVEQIDYTPIHIEELRIR